MKNTTEEQMLQSISDTIINPLVSAAVKEKGENPLENTNQYEKRLREQLKTPLKQLQERLQAAVRSLIDRGQWPQDNRYQNVKKAFQDEQQMISSMSEGKTLQNLFNFTAEELTNFYLIGLDLFHQTHYEDASNVFLLLTQLNPLIGNFWSGLALSEEKRGELQDASNAYLFAAGLEEETLAPHIDAIRCLLLLKQEQEAKRILQIAQERVKTEESLKKFKPEIDKLSKLIKD